MTEAQEPTAVEVAETVVAETVEASKSPVERAKEAARATLPPEPVAEPTEPQKPAVEAEKPAEPEAPKEPVEPAKPISRELSAIAARERRIRDLEQRARPVVERAQAYEAATKERDVLKILQHHGLTLDDLQHQLVTGRPPEPKPEERVAQVEKRLADWERQQAEQELQATQAQQKQVISDFQAEITTTIESTNEYPLIKANGATEMVYRVIDQHFQDTGSILDIAEAAKHVESELRAFVAKGYELINPPTAKVSGEKPTAGKDTKEQATKTPKPIETLTNSLSTPSVPDKPGVRSNQERIERAMKAARATL